MKYIYIDESGDLGDKYSSSKYFVIASVQVDNPQSLKRIIKNIKKAYPDIVGRNLEIKATKTDPHIIKKILARTNNIDCDVSAIYLDKKNLHNIPNFYNHHVLYDTLASKLAKKIIVSEPTRIIVDRSKSKHEDIRNFNERFKSGLNNVDNHLTDIIHANSIKEKGLQIADVIAWSVFQSVEHDNSQFIDMIENKNICEVFK